MRRTDLPPDVRTAIKTVTLKHVLGPTRTTFQSGMLRLVRGGLARGAAAITLTA